MRRDLGFPEPDKSVDRHELHGPGPLPDRSALGRVEPTGHGEVRPIDVRGRYRTYRLRESETVLLRHVGAFRGVRLEDLQRFAYAEEAMTCRDDVRHLRSKGLAAERTRFDPQSGRRDTMVTLTREGAKVARRCVADPRQVVYSDIVRPRDLSHDADVYRMYHAEAGRIEQAGGRVRRIMLDHELKRDFYHSIHPSDAGGGEATLRAQVAARHGLTLVSGTVQFPDLRIEYEGPTGDIARVDLELATRHYHGAQLAAKAQAGFRMYAPADDVGYLQSVLGERDLIVEILSL